MTKLINSNKKKMITIPKIVKSLEESDLLIKDVSETIKSKSKEQAVSFASIVLGILHVSHYITC